MSLPHLRQIVDLMKEHGYDYEQHSDSDVC